MNDKLDGQIWKGVMNVHTVEWKEMMEDRLGWINRMNSGPPLQVLWCQRVCYQQRQWRLPPGARSPVSQRGYHDSQQLHHR